MRLYAEEEKATKVVQVEDYTFFRSLINKPILKILLFVYIAVSVILAATSIISGGYLYGGIDLVVHALMIWGLFQFRKANLGEGNELSDKGVKKILVSNAVKYILIFITLIIFLVVFLISWIGKSNAANVKLAQLATSTDLEAIEAAKEAKAEVGRNFWPCFITFLVIFNVGLSYLYVVMKLFSDLTIYKEKGTHFWGFLKYAAIILFVAAGCNVILGVIYALAPGQNLINGIALSNLPIDLIVGGTSIIALIGRVICSIFLAFFGYVLLKGKKQLDATVTSHEETIEY